MMIKAVTIYNKIERLRQAIRREGTPAIQDSWDQLEPHVSIFLNAGGLCGAARENEANDAGSGNLGRSEQRHEVLSMQASEEAQQAETPQG